MTSERKGRGGGKKRKRKGCVSRCTLKIKKLIRQTRIKDFIRSYKMDKKLSVKMWK